MKTIGNVYRRIQAWPTEPQNMPIMGWPIIIANNCPAKIGVRNSESIFVYKKGAGEACA